MLRHGRAAFGRLFVFVGFGLRCACVCWGGFGFALAAAVCVCAGIRRAVFAAQAVWFACVCAGIRVLLACFTRCPCAGRHLLFFAAAKKSRQKKAANTASPSSYPRAPNGPVLHTAAPLFACVANASNKRLTRFEYPYSGKRQRTVYAAQVANCVEVVASYA